MNELITKLMGNAQSMVSPIAPVLGTYLIIKGLIRLANGNDAVHGGTGGGRLIVIGSLLTCYKLTSWVVLSTLKQCGLNIGSTLVR